MKLLFISLLFSSAFAQAPQFKEVICWNSAGKQILKLNAQKVEVDDDKVEIYLKARNTDADYTMVNVSCAIKKL